MGNAIPPNHPLRRLFGTLTEKSFSEHLGWPDLKVTEWLTRRGNEIEYRVRVEDPAVLAEPWQPRPRRMVLTDIEMAEPAPCVEQDLSHMMDDSFHANPR